MLGVTEAEAYEASEVVDRVRSGSEGDNSKKNAESGSEGDEIENGVSPRGSLLRGGVRQGFILPRPPIVPGSRSYKEILASSFFPVSCASRATCRGCHAGTGGNQSIKNNGYSPVIDSHTTWSSARLVSGGFSWSGRERRTRGSDGN